MDASAYRSIEEIEVRLTNGAAGGGPLAISRDIEISCAFPDATPDESAQSWFQAGLVPAETAGREVYTRLAGLAGTLLGDGAIKNFFFMHKPPALRVRFQTGLEHRDVVADEIRSRLDGWRKDGLLDLVTGGVYEAETHLFGGLDSMRHVHRLFTTDSLAWLAFHTTDQAGSPWVFSLALIRSLLDGLRIVGWEDLDMWNRIHHQTGRAIPAGLSHEKVHAVAKAVRLTWAEAGGQRDLLSEAGTKIADQFAPMVASTATEWSRDYFHSGHALIGPREAAAFYTIFHWNRGGLSLATQMLIATALCDRSARP